MELAFELPIKHLTTLGKYNDYNFTLAHLASNVEYATYYRSTRKYTICDNSAFELSQPLPAEEIIKAAGILNAQEIIAPDAMGSGAGTIKATNDFINFLDTSGNLGKYKVMGVVQGANVPDWANCLSYMNNNKHVDVIGLSYMGCKCFKPDDLTNARLGAVHLATHSAAGNTIKPIHLLGIGNNPLELKYQTNENIRSCDTSLPVVEGYFNNRLHVTTGLEKKLSRPDNYFDLTLNAAQLADIVYNIETMKSWISVVNAK